MSLETREVPITYTRKRSVLCCDGHTSNSDHCTSEVLGGEESYPHLPDNWYEVLRVKPEERGKAAEGYGRSYDYIDYYHFCSLNCLFHWILDQHDGDKKANAA